MREIPMPPDLRPIAHQAALDAARNDDGLRVGIVQAIWRDGELPTAGAQTGGFVYEIADRIARAVEKREQEISKRFAAAIERSVCAPGEQCADRFCPDCVRYRQAKADAALVRKMGGTQGRVEYQANGQEG